MAVFSANRISCLSRVGEVVCCPRYGRRLVSAGKEERAMDVGVQAVVEHLEETWDALLKAAAEADDVAFYWTPGPEFNSAAILLRHLAGSERWWIGEGIGEVPSHRNREAEFLHDRPRREDVLRSVDEARRITRRVLAPLTVEHLREATAPAVT